MKVSIDRDGCIGCGLCSSVCPEVFVMGDDNIASVLAEDVPDTAEGCAKEAEDSCPVSVIRTSE